MPIPALDPRGVLPVGLHTCTFDEIRERFGQFQGSDRRRLLSDRLEAYIDEVRLGGLVAWLVVDGSFVTDTSDPRDIDLVVVLRADQDPAAELRPFQYNAISRRRVRKRHDFDVLVAREGSRELGEYIGFFQRVRGKPEVTKGVLRVNP